MRCSYESSKSAWVVTLGIYEAWSMEYDDYLMLGWLLFCCFCGVLMSIGEGRLASAWIPLSEQD